VKGSGPGEFQFPRFVCFGPQGNLYVSDFGNHRIQVFDTNGVFLQIIGGEFQFRHPQGISVCSRGFLFVADQKHCVQVFTAKGLFVRKFGRTVPGQSDGPYGVTVDVNGNCVVADFWNHQIQIFNSTGQLVKKFGSPGTRDLEFNGCFDVAISKEGDLIVSDQKNHCFKVFSFLDQMKVSRALQSLYDRS